VTIEMTDPVYIGVCVTSNAAGQARTFEFDNIKSTGGVSGLWAGAVIDSPLFNDPSATYVTLGNSSNKSATVVDPNTAKVNINGWREWKIPLNQFTGMTLTNVNKVTIGVGDRTNKTKGGTGKLFIDDIRVIKPAP
jgi:hypothetical protein